MNFGSKILRYQEDIIRDLAALVAIPSVCSEAEEGKPFGTASAEALHCILNMAEEMGLSTKNVGNYAGHAEYGQGSEVAAVLAHVDVVPVGEGWDTDPYVLTKKGSCYFGRGTADDKGAAIVALYALRILKEENILTTRRVRVVFGAGEETGSDDMVRYFQSESMPTMGFTPDSEYGICNREKGILRMEFVAENDSSAIRQFVSGTVVNAVPCSAEVQLTCTEDQIERLQEVSKTAKGNFTFNKSEDGICVHSIGTASHAMQPQEGFNAATHLIALLSSAFTEEELGTLITFLKKKIGTELDGNSMGVQQSDTESGPLTLNLGIVNLGSKAGSASIDIRYPVTTDGQKIVDAISSHAETEGLRAEVSGHMKPLFLPSNSALITLLQESYACFMGKPAELYATGGGTYARAMEGRGVAFGPIFQDEPDRRLHNTNENIDIHRFMLHAQICLEAMYRMAIEK